MIQLRRLAVLAKTSPSEDFRLTLRPNPPLPETVAKAAYGWLQAHIDSGNEQSVTVASIGDELWLFRGTEDLGTDNVGRRLAYLAFGEIAEHPAPHPLTRLLFGAFRDRKPAREDRDACEIELGPESAATDERAVQALLCLALGVSQYAVVDNDATAALVIESLGMHNLAFVSLMRRQLPSRWPAGCVGLVVSQAHWEPPSIAQTFQVSLRELRRVDLSALMRLDCDSQRREVLLRSALLGDDGDELNSCPPEGFDWLIQSEGGRGVALQRSGAAQLSAWLKQKKLTLKDIDLIDERIAPQDSCHIAHLLRGVPDGVSRFVRKFGHGAPGIEEVLPPGPAALWVRINNPEETWELPPEEEAARLLETAGLLGSLPAPIVRRLLASPLRKFIEPRWRDLMLAAGMHRLVYSELFDGNGELIAAPPTAPAPDPREDWVWSVPKDFLWKAGQWASGERRWRKWWAACVRLHPELGSSAMASLHNVWSETAGAWTVGATRDGEASPEMLLTALMIWRGRPAVPSLTWQHSLLRAAGLTASDRVMALLLRQVPAMAPTQEDQRDLRALIRARVLDEGDVVSGVLSGAAPLWLESAGFATASVALLDESQLPPVEPPGDWVASLDGVLAQACRSPRFWRRFNGQLSLPMLRWIIEHVGRYPDGVRVQELFAAYSANRCLCAEDLERFVPALPSTVVCRQIMAWAWDFGPDREKALRTLLASASLRPELRSWLATELLTLTPTPTLPILTPDEATTLLPLLHPIRDVLRPLLARPEEWPGEHDLAESLAEALTRLNVPSPAVPPSGVALRHRYVVQRLALVPGWESWKRMVDSSIRGDGAAAEEH